MIGGSLRTEMDHDSKTRAEWPHYGFAGPEDSGRYSMVLACRDCDDRVMVVGRYQHEEWEIDRQTHMAEVFYPEYFVPAIPLIAIPPACPPSVRAALEHAFAAYWALPGQAANAIRVALERLMDALGIFPVGTLHARLTEFAKQHPGPHADFLMAANWVGNAGSHDGVALHNHVRDILQMVEVTLASLYSPDLSALAAKAAQFIEHKGRPT